VVGRLGIHPPWCDPIGEVAVSIDPGPTFGHGAHPTTTLALAEVNRLVGPGTSVLDVGCGSGVLAIAAARLGASPVTGIDIEEDAVAWTLQNAAVNKVEVEASSTPITGMTGTWDLVLANVLPAVHEKIGRHVVARVGGTLVVSGVPDEHTDRVSGHYRRAGLTESRRICEAGWTALVLTREEGNPTR